MTHHDGVLVVLCAQQHEEDPRADKLFEETLSDRSARFTRSASVCVWWRRDDDSRFGQRRKSMKYVAETPAIRELVTVNDGHDLLASLDVIGRGRRSLPPRSGTRRMTQATFCIRCDKFFHASSARKRRRSSSPMVRGFPYIGPGCLDVGCAAWGRCCRRGGSCTRVCVA